MSSTHRFARLLAEKWNAKLELRVGDKWHVPTGRKVKSLGSPENPAPPVIPGAGKEAKHGRPVE